MRGGPLRAWVRALEAVQVLDQSPAPTLASMLDGLAREHGDRPALLTLEGGLSFRELAAGANRIARWATARGLAGTTVCLLMPNRPEYVAIWLGLTRAGCVVALINTAGAADSLRHCVTEARATHLIVDPMLWTRVEALTPALARLTWPALLQELADLDGAPLEQPFPEPGETALLVYTSGTTGWPKAVRITHARILQWALWFAGMMDVQPADRLYDCLPLYHSTGGIVAIGAMLVRGGSVLIAPGFSASRFWGEVVESECTLFLYIGELCRYLAQSPPDPREGQHRLRLACGNGLRGEVWTAFQQRFAIPSILEFYAATEGSVSLYNCEGKPGAIGRVPPFLASRFPFALIRVDESGVPLRDAAGFCIACGPEEPGEAIGPVGAGARRFDGYTDAAASARKLLTRVFAEGDCWFRTEDLMRRDDAGFIYFVDRMGDTFRWKGENVSTTEVADNLRACAGVRDAVVYGVRVPGQEGRAGMAAIVPDDGFDLQAFTREIAARLPPYAQPAFVRLCRSLDQTGTFKLSTIKLAAEGYEAVGDPTWFRDAASGRYVPCDLDLCRAIADGTRRT